jgi:hypothetical protein
MGSGSGVLAFVGAFFALTALWAVNHPDAVGSSGSWTSWVSPGTRRALVWFQLVAGLAMLTVAAFL